MLKRLALAAGFTASLFCTLVLPVTARAGEFVFVRPGDPERIFSSAEALEIELPARLADSELNNIFIEIDGVDVTQLVALNGRRVVYTPPAGHMPGAHTLRLVRKANNGKLVEINRWNFTVSGAPPAQQATTFSGVVDATYSSQPWNTGPAPAHPPRHNLNALTQFEGATQSDGWQFSAKGHGYLNSQDRYNPAGQHAEIGEYLLSAEQASEDGSLLFRMGNHDIGASNILMQGFYRRGISARAAVMENQLAVTGFAQDPAPNIGNRNAAGFADENQRASGAHVIVRPFAALKERLELEGTAYSGHGIQTSGTAAGFGIEPHVGRGFQLGLRSVLWPDIVSVRLQQAFTEFDFDGDGAGAEAFDDQARRFSLTLTPLGSQVSEDGRLEMWDVELAYQRTGTLYESLITQFDESDREKYALTSTYNHAGTAVVGEVAFFTNNVNDYAVMPTDRAVNTWVQASHAPEEEWWGRPVFFMGGSLSDEVREKTPAGFTGTGLDQITLSANGGFSLSFERIVGTLSHTYTKFNDLANVGTGYNSHLTDLSAEFKPADWMTLRPGLQFERVNQAGGATYGYHASLGTDVVFIPDTFWSQTRYSLLVGGRTGGVGDRHNLESEFTWLFKAAEKNSPGYAAALAVMHGNLTNPNTNLVQADEGARLFLRLKTSAPFANE